MEEIRERISEMPDRYGQMVVSKGALVNSDRCVCVCIMFCISDAILGYEE